MNHHLSDPNNHVPEVSPEDSWGDPDQVRHERESGTTMLPARRTLADPSPSASHLEVGLRIEANPARLELEDFQQRLEVQEISGDVIRLDPEIDPPAKIERQFTFHERPPQENPKKKPKRLGINVKRLHRNSPRWILVMGLMVMVMVVSSLMMLPAINAPNAPREDTGRMILSVVEEKKIKGMDNLTALLELQPEALRIFRSYAQAAGLDEITPMVRDGKDLHAPLRAQWKPLGVPKSWTPSEDSSWDLLDLGDRAFGLLEGNLPDGSQFSAYFTLQEGRLLLDWKPTVGFGTASFTDLSRGVGDGREIRGELSRAQYYNAAYPEADYRGYSLTSPDRETTIWCYTRRGEAADAALGALFNRSEIIGESKSIQKATLRLTRGPEGSMPNQWVIQELLHIDWATP
jgi:hypothetical protein